MAVRVKTKLSRELGNQASRLRQSRVGCAAALSGGWVACKGEAIEGSRKGWGVVSKTERSRARSLGLYFQLKDWRLG